MVHINTDCPILKGVMLEAEGRLTWAEAVDLIESIAHDKMAIDAERAGKNLAGAVERMRALREDLEGKDLSELFTKELNIMNKNQNEAGHEVPKQSKPPTERQIPSFPEIRDHAAVRLDEDLTPDQKLEQIHAMLMFCAGAVKGFKYILKDQETPEPRVEIYDSRKAELVATLRSLRVIGDYEMAHTQASNALLEYIDDAEVTEALNALERFYA